MKGAALQGSKALKKETERAGGGNRNGDGNPTEKKEKKNGEEGIKRKKKVKPEIESGRDQERKIRKGCANRR